MARDLLRMLYKQLGDSNHSGKLSPSKKKTCVGLPPVRSDQRSDRTCSHTFHQAEKHRHSPPGYLHTTGHRWSQGTTDTEEAGRFLDSIWEPCKMAFSPNLIVAPKILSSEYQSYACGKILIAP
jgi:hypothetical protein